MSVHASGHRVVYQPLASIVHREFGSSERTEYAIELQRRHQEVFVAKWRERLRTFPSPDPNRALFARTVKRRRRMLFVDDRIPDPALGSGYPRSHRLVTTLAEEGTEVTAFPLH